MKTKDFFFELPPELIAQEPLSERGQSRLLVYRRSDGSIEHSKFDNLPNILAADTCMVFNNSRVRKARIFACSQTGARFELVLIKALDPEHKTWQAIVKKSSRLKLGQVLSCEEGISLKVGPGRDGLHEVYFEAGLEESWLERHGHVPLPPYIRRTDNKLDQERYQTVFSRHIGSAAAPTAALHFTKQILEAIDQRQIQRLELTLHVGLGTFFPVRADSIEDHTMHKESFEIQLEVAQALDQARNARRPILAVGTTSARSLESSLDAEGKIQHGQSDTSIFIYPGYKFRLVNQLLTNFHTPESTLIMMVSALIGREEVMRIYQEAIKERYRFFSYGDAMLVL